MITKEMMTTKELADILKVTPKHIWDLQREQIIPSIKVGRVHRFDLDVVLRKLEEYATK
jgi:excisionase family DNA binding protein